jgi:hypothetical protein
VFFGNHKKKMAAADVALIVLIFLVLIAFLVMVIASSTALGTNLSLIGNQLAASLTAVFQTLTLVTANVVQVFDNLRDSVQRMLENVIPKVGTAFVNTASYLRDNLNSLGRTVEQEIAPMIIRTGSTVVSSFMSIAAGFATLLNQIEMFVANVVNTVLGLMNRGVAIVSDFFSFLLRFLIVNMAKGIAVVIDGIQLVVEASAQLVATGLDNLPAAVASAQEFITSSLNSVVNTFRGILSQITAFGTQIANTFNAIPHLLACVLRCVCHFTPFITCPVRCCTPNDASCNDACFFPANCCRPAGFCPC